MNQALKIILISQSTFVLVILANQATAAKLSSPLMVYAAVTDNCSISTDPGRLSGYDPILVALPSPANDLRSLAVKCTTGTDPEISVASTHPDAEHETGRLRDTVVATVTF